MLESYLNLIKEQNRTICTLRFMMERGYFIVRIHKQMKWQWALCKHPTPKDKDTGFVLFKTYDEAYEMSQRLVWVDSDLRRNCDIVYPLALFPKTLVSITKNRTKEDEDVSKTD